MGSISEIKMFKCIILLANFFHENSAQKPEYSEKRPYPSPQYIGYLTKFDTSHGVPMPDGKWWGHRRERVPGRKIIESRVFNMTLATVGLFSDAVSGQSYYSFTGRGHDRAHPRAPPSTGRDLSFMKIGSEKLFEDFSWEMDVDLYRRGRTYHLTYFGTYFTHANYHPRLSKRPLKMSKPNNGWVLQGCITCRKCKVCYVYSGVSLFPDQLSLTESVEAAHQRIEDVFSVEEIGEETSQSEAVEGIERRKQALFNGNPRVRVRRIIHRLKLLVKNIGTDTKHGKDNTGEERKRYNGDKKTTTVFQGSDTPQELYNYTVLMIKERFSRKRNQGAHLQHRLDKIYRNLCISYTAYCMDD